MLILAGITLVYVFGDNGIFSKAQEAKGKTQEAEEKEKFMFIGTNLKTDSILGKEVTTEKYFAELKKQGLISDTIIGGKNIKEIEPDKDGNNRYEIRTEKGFLAEIEFSTSGEEDFTWKGLAKAPEDIPKVDGFVAFFNQVYNNSTTSKRNIAVVEHNAEYADEQDNVITIKEQGDYTAYVFVGRSASEGFSTYGHIYVDGELVKNSSNSSNYVSACSNTQSLSGMKSYPFSVDKGSPISISYSISSDSTYGERTYGAMVIVRRGKDGGLKEDGLVAVLDTIYTTSSTAQVSVPIGEYNSNYAQVEGHTLKITEPGDYTLFATVGRSSPYGFSLYGDVIVNGSTLPRTDGYVHTVSLCPNNTDVSGARMHRFSVGIGETVSLEFKMVCPGAWSGRNCGTLIVVKNS